MNGFSIEQTRGSASIAAKWARALSLGKDLNGVLAEFQALHGADTVQIVRLMRNMDRARMVARHETSSGKLFARPPRSFVATLLGDLLHRTSPGSVIMLTEMCPGRETEDHLDQFGLREVVVLSLSREQDFSDYLELHFARRPLEHNCQLLKMLGSVLSQSWRERARGAVESLIAGQSFPVVQDRGVNTSNVLDEDNPAGLTRAEYRICALVQEGVLPNQLAKILQVSNSTFRAHLSAIYCKTGVSGHIELVHLLHRSGAEASGERSKQSVRR